MSSQTVVDTEELIESLGRFRRWVLPSGVMRELLSRGAAVGPALIERLTRALADKQDGLEPKAQEAFFCFHLLSVAPVSQCQQFIEKLLVSGEDIIDLCTGEVTQPFFRALITSLADPDDPAVFCEWIDSLVQDDRVSFFAKSEAVASLYNLLAESVLEDAEAVRWLRKWLNDRRETKYDEFSALIVGDLIDVGGTDLKELAIECFERDQIETSFVSIDCLDHMSAERQWDRMRAQAEADRQLLSDPLSYLERWHAFAWSTEDLDPRSATHQRITTSSGSQNRKAGAKEIEQWLAEIDGSSYEVYPRAAVAKAYGYVGVAIEPLKDRVRQGIESTRLGEPWSSNGPYLSALLLAHCCNDRDVLFEDADLFFEILDLTVEQREEWFGDAIDSHLIEALVHILAGNPQPILQRIRESSRCELDRASLVEFFPMAVYYGYLSREQGLEILREIWESSLGKLQARDDEQETQLGATFDAFCLLSIADDDPVLRQAEEEGIENLFLDPELMTKCRTTPSEARDIVKSKLLAPRDLEGKIKSGLQFSSTAIDPPPPKAARTSGVSRPSSTGGGTIRSKSEKAGRNDPCPCGSGKKYKKCCGKR